MEPLRAPSGIVANNRVQERQAGGGQKGSAEAFRRALQQEGGESQTDRPPAPAKPPMRSRLQSPVGIGRNQDQAQAGHVDVVV